MALNTFDFEGTDNATLSGTNITLQGTGTAVFSSADAVVGGTGGRCTATAGLTRFVRCTLTTASLTMAVSPYVRTPMATSTIGTPVTVGSLRTAAGAAALRIMYNPTSTTLGDVGVQGVTGGFRTVATGVGLGVMLRWEILLVVATASTGTITAKAYSGTGFTTLLGTFTNAVFDAGIAEVASVEVGACTAITPGSIVGFDYLRAEDGRTTEFGAPPAVSSPTANAGPDQDVQAGVVVTLTGAASTAGSGTLTYSWGSPTEIPPTAATPSVSGQATSTATFTATTPGRYTFPLTVTQTGGLTATDSVTIWVYPASNAAVRVYSVAATTGTNEGGAASLAVALNDSVDTTYFQSALSPVAATDFVTVTAAPFGPGVIAWTVDAYYQTQPCTLRVRVYKADGTTVIGDATHTLTTTKTSYTTQVDETLIPAQTDRRALVVKSEPAVI